MTPGPDLKDEGNNEAMMPNGYRVALRAVLLALTVAIIAALIWPSVRQTLAAIFGLLVGAATIAYALLTARMVHATDKMRVAQEKLTQTTAEALEVQTRPNVIISIELHSFLGYLVVQNAGVGEAFDVRVECVGSLQSFPDQLLTEARFLADGFTYLAPSQKHAALFFNTTRPFPPDPRLHLAVRYRSRAGAPYVAEFPLDVGELKGVALQYSATERGLEKLVEIHEELKKK